MHDNKSWARHYDTLLLELASYQVSEGLTILVKEQGKIYERFAEFKGLIKRGSFTLKQLEDSVYGKFGIMPQKEDTHNYLSMLERLKTKTKTKTKTLEGKGIKDVEEETYGQEDE